MEPKDVRVVIPCYNADATINQCLSSIFQSTDVAFEVVLVDDGETKTLAALSASHPFSMVKTAGQQGAGNARNLGASGFRGKVLAFIDADVIVEQRTISYLIQPIIAGCADAAVGRYSPIVRTRKLADAYKQLYLAYTYSRPKKELKNTFWTALGAVRTECFRAVSGFETRFRGAGPEDLDLGVKLSSIKATIVSVPEAVADHLVSRGMVGLMLNDLRKGSEDFYVHLKKNVPLTDNRHAGISSIGAVAAAWLVPVLSAVPDMTFMPWIFGCLYFCFHWNMFVKGFLPSGLKMFFAAIPITFVLDLIRGFAVIFGTACVLLERASFGHWKPFSRIGKEGAV